MLHVLGGMGAAFFGLLFIKTRKQIGVLLFAGFIGITWEFFERLGHVWWPTLIGFGGTWDTIFDILYAILGAVIVIAYKTTWQKNNTTHI